MHRRELSRTEEPFCANITAVLVQQNSGIHGRQGRGFTESYWGRIVSGNRNDDFLAAVIFGRFAKQKRLRRALR